MHHQHTVVQPDLSFGKPGFAETGTSSNLVDFRTILAFQQRLDGIEVTIAPRPEMQTAYRLMDFYSTGLAR